MASLYYQAFMDGSGKEHDSVDAQGTGLPGGTLLLLGDYKTVHEALVENLEHLKYLLGLGVYGPVLLRRNRRGRCRETPCW